MQTDDKIRALLKSGFETEGRHFSPAVYFRLASEPEYGCEERSETAPQYGELCGLNTAGAFCVPIEEHALWASRFDDNQWLGTLEGMGLVLLTRREGRPDRIQPAPRGPWLALLGVTL